LISLLPWATADGEDKPVAVRFKVAATMTGQAEVVLVDKSVNLVYKAKKGFITGTGTGPGPATPDSDTTRPTVLIALPTDAATGVAINRKISATFSEQMDSSMLTTLTMTLQQGTTPVPGTVTYTGITASFKQTSDRFQIPSYTATITTGAKDLAGNALAGNFVWTFTTGFTAAPQRVDKVPAAASQQGAGNGTCSLAPIAPGHPRVVLVATRRFVRAAHGHLLRQHVSVAVIGVLRDAAEAVSVLERLAERVVRGGLEGRVRVRDLRHRRVFGVVLIHHGAIEDIRALRQHLLIVHGFVRFRRLPCIRAGSIVEVGIFGDAVPDWNAVVLFVRTEPPRAGVIVRDLIVRRVFLIEVDDFIGARL